jgi:hypothetical protein
MVRERITAKGLAEMITAKIGASGLEIVVREDHAYGWQPNVVTAPGDLMISTARRRDCPSASRSIRFVRLI